MRFGLPTLKTPLIGLIAVLTLLLFYETALADPRDLYQKIMISLVVDGEETVFILLASDGTINRSGTGRLKNEDPEVYIGKTDEPLFEKLMGEVPSYIFDHQGVYHFPDQEGEKCILTLIFESEDGKESAGFRFDYGYRSGGPPGDILKLVEIALTLTGPWYEFQKN